MDSYTSPPSTSPLPLCTLCLSVHSSLLQPLQTLPVTLQPAAALQVPALGKTAARCQLSHATAASLVMLQPPLHGLELHARQTACPPSSCSRLEPHARLLQDVLLDLGVVREGLDDLVAHVNGLHKALGLEVVERELVADLSGGAGGAGEQGRGGA